jgi:hypothetical protein
MVQLMQIYNKKIDCTKPNNCMDIQNIKALEIQSYLHVSHTFI